MSRQTVYLIDGTSLCYRAFFAIKLSNSLGFPTGAVYGYVVTLTKLLEKFQISRAAVCFDLSRQTFRQEKYKEYKITRPPAPDDLCRQIPLVKQITKYLGLTVVEQAGYEADDLIAGLAKLAQAQNYNTVVISTDKDLLQLIDQSTVVFDPVKELIIDQQEFIKKYEFDPRLMIDYLALTGDASDNIPGAKGIGKVGAQKLVKQFGTVEKMFENLEMITGKTKEALINSQDMVKLSKELVTLVPQTAQTSIEELNIKPVQTQQACQMFKELEFRSLLKKYADCQPSLISVDECKVDLKQLIEEKKVFLYGHESMVYGFCPKTKTIVSLSSQQVKELLADQTVSIVTIGAKKALFNKALPSRISFDLEIAGYLLDPSSNDYSLESLINRYLDAVSGNLDPKQYPQFIYQLYQIFSKKLVEQELDKLFFELEMPLVSVLANMQIWGVSIDQAQMSQLLTEVDEKISQIQKQIYAIAGKEFNLNSPSQVGKVLFEDLKIPAGKKTKTGYSTNEEVLEKIALEFKIAKHLLEYRQLYKLKTTYILPLQTQVIANQGKLQAQFNQTGTATGRLSSSSPNLQSIPARGNLADQLRRSFVSSFEKGLIVCADYSQIELRILAHFSQDPELIKAFVQDQDVHQITAGIIFGIDPSQVSQTQRDMAKRVNFGIMYGMSGFGLAKELGVGIDQAQIFIDQYFSRYAKVQEYFQSLYAQARSTGNVRTILGRKRDLADINSSVEYLREFAHRQAINTPIQGSCADLIKTAMVLISRDLQEKKLNAKMIMQIHDELVFDLPEQELDQLVKLIRQRMETALDLSVPIKVNIFSGKNWSDVKEI